jgi:hypothetical protein
MQKISKICLLGSLSLFSVLSQTIAIAAELNLHTNANCVAIGQKIDMSYQSNQNGYVSLWNRGASGEIIRLLEQPVYAYQKRQLTLSAMGPVGTDEFYLLWTPDRRTQPRWTKFRHLANFQKAISTIQQAKIAIRTVSQLENCQKISAPADQRRKNMVMVPTNNNLTVELALTVKPITVKVGEPVEITFQSNQSGYVTLWDIGTSGKVNRFFPAPHKDMRIQADRQYRIGPFAVGKPLGMEDIYLLWTNNASDQPEKLQYHQAMALSKDVRIHTQATHEQAWETAKVTFEIVDPNEVTAPPTRISPWHKQSEIYILAMGADVEPLTKTNDDAKQFVDTMQSLFVFIFFSGHGDSVKDDNGDEKDGLDEAFVMMDASESLYPPQSYLILDEQFAQWVNNLNTEKVITVIDACHSGGLNKGYTVTNARVKSFSGGDPKRLIPAQKNYSLYNDLAGGIDKSKGLVLAAAKESEKALEVQQGGLFITTLMQQWASGQESNLLEVFEKARETVKAATDNRQTPTLVGNEALAREFNRY